MIVSSLRIIRFALQNFARNIWLTVATVSVLVLTLVSVNVLLTMNVMAKVALTTVKSKIDVSAHFKPDVDESRVQSVKTALLSLQEVKDVEYVSPGEAMQRFTEDFGKDASVLESLGEVGENPFGATLVVTATDLEGYPKILAALSEPVFANLIEEKDFDDRQAMIGRLDSIFKKIEVFGIAVSGVFGLITLLIVFNTIRVSIYTHKEEIGIMRLVGASDGFIRGPYYVEAVLWSLVALGLCLLIVYPSVGFSEPMLRRFFGTGDIDLLGFFGANFLRVFGFEFAMVAFMALATTKLATARYLKV